MDKKRIDINKVKIIDESDETTDASLENYPNNINNDSTSKIIKKPPKKLGLNPDETKYVRPPITLTEMLSRKDIEGLLLDYVKVDNLETVKIGSQIRYFEYKDNELKFRIGGTLKIKGLPDYVILSNGSAGWSVQVKNCIFFRLITADEVREEMNKIILNKDIELDKLRSLIKQQRKDILNLKKQLKDRK